MQVDAMHAEMRGEGVFQSRGNEEYIKYVMG